MPIRIRALLGLAITIIVCVILYWPTMQGPFLFDDFPNLAALTSIDHVSSWRDLGIYLSQPRSFPGRPLAMLSFLLQKSAWPDHPLPFRLVNVGLHLLNGVLVYLLVLRLARTYLADQVGERRAWLGAGLATAAWLLDPIQLSGVVLVVQRMTLLMAFFVLLGLLAYLRALLATGEPVWRRGIWMMLGLGACTVLAFLSKENGILLPLYVLVLDATVLRQAVHQLPKRLLWLHRLLVWPVVLFVLGYLLWQIRGQWGVHGFRDFTLGERLLTEPRALASYLDKTFLPRFGLYGLYHDSFVVSKGLFSPWTTSLCLLALLSALVVALVGTRRWPLLSLAILWYLGGQLLESSTVMLELYFEHRNYLPLVGVMAALAIGIACQPPQRQRLCLLASGLWLLACCLTSALSARVYSSAERVAATWAHSQPDSIRAQSFLAQQLLQHGMASQSLQVIDAISTRYPNNAGLAENRLYLLCVQGRLTPQDIQRMDNTLRVAPFDRSGFDNMSTLREMAAGRQCAAFDDQAWLQSVDILLGNPAYRNDGLAAGFLHYQKHFWAVAHGQLDMTIKELDETYRNDPDAEVPRLQAKYLASAGLYDQAIDVLRRTDYSRLPFLRRLLVDDRAINTVEITEIEKMRHSAAPEASKSP